MKKILPAIIGGLIIGLIIGYFIPEPINPDYQEIYKNRCCTDVSGGSCNSTVECTTSGDCGNAGSDASGAAYNFCMIVWEIVVPSENSNLIPTFRQEGICMRGHAMICESSDGRTLHNCRWTGKYCERGQSDPNKKAN